MSYVKWVRNSDPTNGVTEIKFSDEVTLKQGIPVKLSVEDRKYYESLGLVFEDSSAAESRDIQKEKAEEQRVGRDITGTAPVFNRTDEQTTKVSRR